MVIVSHMLFLVDSSLFNRLLPERYATKMLCLAVVSQSTTVQTRLYQSTDF